MTTTEKMPWFDAYGTAARKKLDAPPEWEWYGLKVIGEAGDTLVEGGIPNDGRKGSGRWRGVKGQTCVVTRDEVSAVRAEYERETGNCADCAGSGKTVKSVSVADGVAYRPCSRCEGSGNAALPLAPRTQEAQ